MVGIVIGISSIVFIKPPKNETKQDVHIDGNTMKTNLKDSFKDAFIELRENRTAQYILAAAMMKSLSDYSVNLYEPIFYQSNFKDFSG
jgi:hypothetical protein